MGNKDRRKEKKVDATFVSLQQEIDSATKEEPDTARSSRTSNRRSPREQDEGIPPELRAQLLAEGYDVDGAATAKALARIGETAAANSKENSKPQATGNLARNKVNRSPTSRKERIAQKIKASQDSKKRKPISAAAASTSVESAAITATADAAPPDGSRKRRKSVATSAAAAKDEKPELPISLPKWTDGVKCKKADDFYRRRINAAMAKGVVYLSTSFLSETQEKSLKEL